GVSLIVLYANCVLAWVVINILSKSEGEKIGFKQFLPAMVYAGIYTFVIIGGVLSIGAERSRRDEGNTVKIALIQQNTDPRKNDYSEGLRILRSLTDRAMKAEPDLVVWSETAFVPNIRRWGALSPERYPYARLVREFLDYQAQLGTWLLTGNDDYEIVKGEDGEDERYEYNAGVLFDSKGYRQETYRKIHLVPFTEYFPFKEELPGFHALLLEFDVYLWEPGTKKVVFQHPKFAFSTPICFEDGFPNDVRRFVNAGAEVIINISNDYWSLSEVEARQHYATSIFRSVENRKPLLRASASGVTCSIDSSGRRLGSLPLYEEGYLIAEVSLVDRRPTFYSRRGDWLPLFLAILCFGIWMVPISAKFITRKKNEPE
ncbi:MAG: apolipoprotein N-acyltransferase, partial [Spirochaetales bacterium]|nr:apolipoprotein N-acyltransferase [Spirochaetales bacterium]